VEKRAKNTYRLVLLYGSAWMSWNDRSILAPNKGYRAHALVDLGMKLHRSTQIQSSCCIGHVEVKIFIYFLWLQKNEICRNLNIPIHLIKSRYIQIETIMQHSFGSGGSRIGN
jgi:hypothetical protein